MGRPPLCLCVVRHGNRLDAADQRWQETSPTPYDPPLTYSGWHQTQALGTQISQTLAQRIEEHEALRLVANPEAKRKRYQVIIHSSPFLRCIQTAVAISAGITRGPLPGSSSTNSRPSASTSARPTTPHPVDRKKQTYKCVLRLDACFGEWLSEDYFQTIVPPPKSAIMISRAKADLLQRPNYDNLPHLQFASRKPSAESTGLWVSPRSTGQLSPLEDLGPLDDASSPTSGISALFALRASKLRSNSTMPVVADSIQYSSSYSPPALRHPASNNGPIPEGLVTHARDECLEFDYQWDSAREPLSWGDGGSFPEEWVSMHKRFRQALQSLVNWYNATDKPQCLVTRTVHSQQEEQRSASQEVEDDVECETIVIIVSHGAGCNALIGAITQKPVLTDVGLASLTLAVRHEDYQTGMPMPLAMSSVPGSVTSPVPLNEVYNLQILAAADHRRSSSLGSSLSVSMTTPRDRVPSGGSLSTPGSNSILAGWSGPSRSSSAAAAVLWSGGSGDNSLGKTPAHSPTSSFDGTVIGGGIKKSGTISSSCQPLVGLWRPPPATGTVYEQNSGDGECATDDDDVDSHHERGTTTAVNTAQHGQLTPSKSALPAPCTTPKSIDRRPQERGGPGGAGGGPWMHPD